MQFYELHLTVLIKEQIWHNFSYEQLSKLIASAMSQDEEFKKLHHQTSFKHYCFNNLYKEKMPKNEPYKEGDIYMFKIRSFNKEFIEVIKKYIKQIENRFFKILAIEDKIVKQFFIDELKIITPTISSREIDGKIIYWTFEKDGDIIRLIKQLQDNLEKKYQEYFKKELKASQNFIQMLEFKNKTPQTIVIKNKRGYNIKFFGNKFDLKINEDETSQKLAFCAMACGLGEKNSFGGGFTISKGARR